MAVTVSTGSFDGVHLGHRQIVSALVSNARSLDNEAVVVTLWPHPRNVLQQDARGLRLLNSLEEKKEILLSMGVDRVEVLEFSQAFSRMTARQYIDEVLQKRLGADSIVLGQDNRLGCDGALYPQISSIASSLGMKTFEVEPLSEDGVKISSTKIREALSKGDIRLANSMLGYLYSLRGVVVEGNRLGRTLGYPTANMMLYEPLKQLPSNGVYAVKVHTLGEDFIGMTNVGVRPTVGNCGTRTIETNIFDFDNDIYGLDLKLEFVARIRDERKFGSLEELKKSLDADCRAVRSIFEK